jgi:hypothetical protein
MDSVVEAIIVKESLYMELGLERFSRIEKSVEFSSLLGKYSLPSVDLKSSSLPTGMVLLLLTYINTVSSGATRLIPTASPFGASNKNPISSSPAFSV